MNRNVESGRCAGTGAGQVEEARFSGDEKWTAFQDAQFSAERARLNVLRQTGELRAAFSSII
jgi:hypothetical protein